jgi:hypothetical protein
MRLASFLSTFTTPEGISHSPVSIMEICSRDRYSSKILKGLRKMNGRIDRAGDGSGVTSPA